jgi:hypothetical protein
MKTKIILSLGALLVCASQRVEAVAITGEVAFGGVAILNNTDPTLATAVNIPLAFGAAATGSFSPGISAGTPIIFASPLTDGVTSGVIWTGGGFTFISPTPITFSGADPLSVAVSASGFVDDGPGGFDPTQATLTIAVTKIGDTLGAFGAITVVGRGGEGVPTPDGGATAMLLGLGAFALSTFMRKGQQA